MNTLFRDVLVFSLTLPGGHSGPTDVLVSGGGGGAPRGAATTC